MPQSHRQQPGLACEDCRRRKARCDRVRPICGSCKDSGTTCRYVDKRPQRGPRKGEMLALKNLVANLEQRLGERRRPQQPNHEVVPLENSQQSGSLQDIFPLFEQDSTVAETMPMSLPINMENTIPSSTGHENPDPGTSSHGHDGSSLTSTSLPNISPQEITFTSSMFAGTDICSLTTMDEGQNNIILDQNFVLDWLDDNVKMAPLTPPSGNQQLFDPKIMQSLSGPGLSELMEADLDELYFERVHPVSPNIHRRKYFAWAKQKRPSAGQMAMQYAMRAVAAAVSAQYQPLSSVLCAESRRLLEQMDANGTRDSGDTCIEQIQAWLLLSHWELLCNSEHQAMLTAGRAIRMVQLARLHNIDAWNGSFMPGYMEMNRFPSLPLSDEDSFVSIEEKRRTFWLAYCFDRFCLMHSECPPSLQEESICTRLPAPEANFQNNQPIQMDFLSDALAQNGRAALPPFAKCVVLNSLFSQCISHERFAMSEAASNGSDSRKLWSKYTWLALAVEKRKVLLEQSLPGGTNFVDDPMLTLTTALAACAAINIYQSMAQSAAWTTAEHEDAVPPYKEQAVQAASELVRFIELMPGPISCFKAHPFLPTPVYRAATFLIGLSESSSPRASVYSKRDGDLNILLRALRDQEQVNNLSRSLLCKLKKTLISKNLGEWCEENFPSTSAGSRGKNL